MTYLFNHITYNHKFGHFSTQLTNKNAIVGDVRSGKTALLDAFEFGLTEKIGSTSWASQLWNWAPEKATELYSVIKGQDTIAEYRLAQNKEKYAKTRNLEGAAQSLLTSGIDLFPLRTASDMLSTTDAKVREALARRFAGELNLELKPRGLDSELQALWDAYAAPYLPERLKRDTDEEYKAKCSTPSAQLEILVGMSEQIRKDVVALGKQAAELGRNRNATQAQLDGCGEGTENLATLQTRLGKAIAFESLESTRIQLAQAMISESDARSTAEEARAKQIAAPLLDQKAKYAAIQELEGNLALLRSDCNKKLDKIRMCTTVSGVLASLELTCAHGSKVDVSAQIANAKKIAAATQAELDDLDKKKDSIVAQIAKLQSEITAERNIHQTKAAGLHQAVIDSYHILSNYESVVKALTATVESTAAYEGQHSEVLKERIARLNTKISLEKVLESQEMAVTDASRKQSLAKSLGLKVTALLNRAMPSLKTAAEKSINSFMPAGFEAQLDLEEGKAKWEIRGAGKLWQTKLTGSGSERKSFILSSHAAWASEGIPFIMLDDEDVGPYQTSPRAMRELLEKLGELADRIPAVDAAYQYQTQVFVCGVRESDVPSGWNIIKR